MVDRYTNWTVCPTLQRMAPGYVRWLSEPLQSGVSSTSVGRRLVARWFGSNCWLRRTDDTT